MVSATDYYEAGFVMCREKFPHMKNLFNTRKYAHPVPEFLAFCPSLPRKTTKYIFQ